jgi:hypothetical protein
MPPSVLDDSSKIYGYLPFFASQSLRILLPFNVLSVCKRCLSIICLFGFSCGSLLGFSNIYEPKIHKFPSFVGFPPSTLSYILLYPSRVFSLSLHNALSHSFSHPKVTGSQTRTTLLASITWSTNNNVLPCIVSIP